MIHLICNVLVGLIAGVIGKAVTARAPDDFLDMIVFGIIGSIIGGAGTTHIFSKPANATTSSSLPRFLDAWRDFGPLPVH